jgi:acetylornithine deacetylase/succinyl-diaminopimelate desuccinylase-like protein
MLVSFAGGDAERTALRSTAMDPAAVADHVGRAWDEHILPVLEDYIAVPNVSPLFDTDWDANGHMADAVELVRAWCAARAIDGLQVEVRHLPGRTPLVVCDIPARGVAAGGDDTVILYGHLDKQPPMAGWHEGLGPWTPVRRGDRLFGRGGADDGYAGFASLAAIEAVQAAGGAHARCLVLVEASEESGSIDLEAHVDALGSTLGNPSLVVCLDSGALSYDRVWVTSSLRGLAGLVVTVEVLEEGVHSGDAGGIVPSSFRMLRALLARIEDADTGALLVPELHATVSAEVEEELRATAAEVGDRAAGEFPFVRGARPLHDGDPVGQMRARWWEPALAYVGIDGVPPIAAAGNVLRASTAMKLSFRLPPTVDAAIAAAAVSRRLSEDPPPGARVSVNVTDLGNGWRAPTMAPWLSSAVDDASQAVFGQPARTRGEGGTIPFMAMLGARFPDAQFLVTGVLGPGSNAHGPNEFLHVPLATGLTSVIAHVLDAHASKG